MDQPMLLWDLDDTIIITNPEFEKTNSYCANLLSKEIYGDDRAKQELLHMQRILDLKMVSEFGFIRSRYLNSWLETSHTYFEQHGLAPHPTLLNEIIEAVGDIYVRKYENVPESIEVIESLKNKGFSMAVLTAGEEEVQRKRVIESGVADFMDDIHVYPYKTPETLQEVMVKHSKKNYVMIGNSLKSDIYPALANNILGIHVVKETWQADQYDIDVTNPLYKPIQNLMEIPNLLKTS
ncbi:HAD family hydrolase [Bacillus sp. JJ722]|uniref:HAD family hydrolase n=1 Tax=Bacillus sp. JJ722 TaxID=3122973 RepID=UPI002FFE4696